MNTPRPIPQGRARFRADVTAFATIRQESRGIVGAVKSAGRAAWAGIKGLAGDPHHHTRLPENHPEPTGHHHDSLIKQGFHRDRGSDHDPHGSPGTNWSYSHPDGRWAHHNSHTGETEIRQKTKAGVSVHHYGAGHRF